MAKGATKHNDEAAAPTGPKVTPRLQQRYREEIAPKTLEKFGMSNRMSAPRLQKIVLNVNMGRHIEGTKVPPNVRETVISTLTAVSGQKPIVIKAKKSVSNFKVREGYESSAMVTLRRDRMWHFLDRLINLGAPRIKDFRGLPETSFDKGGNYSMGLVEQGVFPEIDMTRVNFTHGMHINLVFSNSDPEKSRFVLEEFGFPFRKPETN
ncbi:MAG: 50S ribosomal protein L5 [Phycisphaerales bacterium]|nr:MAG: 50S ribosomal protein L5 [Phycisphaerales bacterium]